MTKWSFGAVLKCGRIRKNTEEYGWVLPQSVWKRIIFGRIRRKWSFVVEEIFGKISINYWIFTDLYKFIRIYRIFLKLQQISECWSKGKFIRINTDSSKIHTDLGALCGARISEGRPNCFIPKSYPNDEHSSALTSRRWYKQ